jgi:N-acetylmuramoyl-L-alanine amidase
VRTALASLLCVVTSLACSSKSGGVDGGSPTQTAMIDEGKALLVDVAAAHDVLVEASERIGGAAVAEGGTARGVVLATIAGELRARAYRRTGGVREEDARRALEWWTVATGRTEFAEACRPAIERAELAGEIAHDPRVSYRDLYAARRRLAQASCVGEVDAALDRASTWRPPAEVLAQIDRALAAEGVVGALTEPVDAGSASSRARVLRISRWTTNDSARVVIELDKPAAYFLEPATAGTVRVRLEGVDFGGSAASIEDGKGLLLGGRLAPIATPPSTDAAADPGGTAVILSLSKPAYRRIFFLPEPFRVVVDLTTTPPSTTAQATGPRPLRRIVLDAGHGGTDPGAIGPSGLREKDVTLGLAKGAAPLIAKELGAEVKLTRASDVFVSLEERAAAANAFEADAFVSIHCNAAPGPKRHGMEMYVLDTTRDEVFQRVAQRENGGASAAPGELRAILDDLKLQEVGGASRALAADLQKATMSSLASEFADVIDGGVHGAGFFVLVGARMPAVLMEVTYISNPVEEGYLGKEEFRGRIVDAIVNGLRAYKDGT